MSALSEFYLRRRAKVKPYECVKIAHPNFTKDYYIVRNKVGGLTASLDGSPQVFDYYPLRQTEQESRATLDYGIQIDLGDVGDLVPGELDAVEAADGWETYPTATVIAFRSDDLSAPMVTPVSLEIPSFPMGREGTSFIAQAPSMNDVGTGMLYLTSIFPMLNGLR